jgi:hypothetical protein
MLCQQFFSLPCYFVPLESKYSQHPVSNTINLRASLNVRDQVSNTYKTTDKFIVCRFQSTKQLVYDAKKFKDT